jgi:hypothetical protein
MSASVSQQQPRTTPVVTQEILSVYRQMSEAVNIKEKLRNKIIADLDAGAVIEPGPLTARIRICEQRRFNAKALATVLGATWVNEVKPQLPLSTTRQLIVAD